MKRHGPRERPEESIRIHGHRSYCGQVTGRSFAQRFLDGPLKTDVISRRATVGLNWCPAIGLQGRAVGTVPRFSGVQSRGGLAVGAGTARAPEYKARRVSIPRMGNWIGISRPGPTQNCSPPIRNGHSVNNRNRDALLVRVSFTT